MSELTLEQALTLLDESRQHSAAMMNRLYESLGIDDSDDEVRFKWVMVEIEEMKRQRNELAATVEAFRATLEYFASQEFEWNNPNDSMIDDIHRLLELTTQQHLRDVRAEAGRAGFIAGLEFQRYNAVLQCEIQDRADYYAERIRSGSQL